jgi:hypothetical protein
MQIGDDEELVARGSWFYGGSVRLEIQIVRRATRLGSGDYEDPPEVAEDVSAETYELRYEVAGSPGRHGGQFATLSEARTAAETSRRRSVSWADD